MKKVIEKITNRVRRHKRVRAKITGTENRPRLAVFKSNKFIYAQIIDDESGKTLAEASPTSDKSLKDKSLTEQASAVGKAIAEKAKAKGISEVVFDRGGFLFQGVIKTLADTARENGLKF